jgi:hypothetical protein
MTMKSQSGTDISQRRDHRAADQRVWWRAARGSNPPTARSVAWCSTSIWSAPDPIWPAHVGGLVGPDGLRRVLSDRLDDQRDDQATRRRVLRHPDRDSDCWSEHQMFHEEAVPDTASATVGRLGLGDKLIAVVDHGDVVAHPQAQWPAERRRAAQGHLHPAAEQPRDRAAGIAAAGGGGWPAEPLLQAQLGHLGGDHRYRPPSCGRCSGPRTRLVSRARAAASRARPSTTMSESPAAPSSSRLTRESSPRWWANGRMSISS